jgi:hypothetical protein
VIRTFRPQVVSSSRDLRTATAAPGGGWAAREAFAPPPTHRFPELEHDLGLQPSVAKF